MAEAAVEERVPLRFFCHVCNVKFESTSPTYTCPHCADGFVEQLEANGDNADVDSYMSDSDDDSYHTVHVGGIDVLSLPNEERHMGRFRHASDPNRRRRYDVHHRTRPRPLARLATSNLRQQAPTFENLIQEFIVNLGVGVNMGGNGNMQLFLGNPGDYAWGREGLDAIVTQLLNQMDTTGPPPLAKDVIDAIPMVEVSTEQVDAKLQCSVCWEDFQLNEKVRQLACQHVYHDPCIRPWLELHGTCPICRQDLGNEDDTSSGRNDPPGGNTMSTLQQLFHVVQNSPNVFSGSSTSESSDTTSSSSSSNTDSMNSSESMN